MPEKDIGDIAEVPDNQRMGFDDPNDYDAEAEQDFEVEEGEIVELGGAG